MAAFMSGLSEAERRNGPISTRSLTMFRPVGGGRRPGGGAHRRTGDRRGGRSEAVRPARSRRMRRPGRRSCRTRRRCRRDRAGPWWRRGSRGRTSAGTRARKLDRSSPMPGTQTTSAPDPVTSSAIRPSGRCTYSVSRRHSHKANSISFSCQPRAARRHRTPPGARLRPGPPRSPPRRRRARPSCRRPTSDGGNTICRAMLSTTATTMYAVHGNRRRPLRLVITAHLAVRLLSHDRAITER